MIQILVPKVPDARLSFGRLVFAGVAVALLANCASERRLDALRGDTFAPVNTGSEGRVITPVNQVLTPAGKQVELWGMRPQALALSPDGKVLATSGKTHELVLVNPETGEIFQKIPLPAEDARGTETVSTHILNPDKEGQLSFTGLIFSKDGKRIFLSNVNGSIKIFRRSGDHEYQPFATFPLPEAKLPGRKEDIPSGMVLSPDETRLYVVLNLSNRLLEMDASDGKQLRTFDVGVAPYDVALAKGKAYVSNWGGRRPETNSLTGPAGHGTRVRVDPIRHIASEGSVSIIDLATGKTIKEALTGLHTSSLAVSPNGQWLVAANSGSDTVSILDTAKDEIVETMSLTWQLGDPFGAMPNALNFSPNGKVLYVGNGTQNAVAVVAFRPGHSRIKGLIPTGWFPGAMAYDEPRSRLHVANIKGLGSGKRLKPGDKVEFNSHQYFGSLSLIPLPTRGELARFTTVALENMRRSVVKDAFLPARPDQAPRTVPERTGEPSVFKHVVYIIKENRTYDQVLGDMKEGNGRADLCIFGEKVTPNQHKMSRDFVLLDNTYCSGILSADGHNWADTSIASDYLEKSFAGFPRSYPDGMEDTDVDALSYSSAGFIWDDALAHGKTVRTYGEFTIGETHWKDPARRGSPKFRDFYDDFVNKTDLINIGCRPGIESLRTHMMTNTIGWDLKVPDIYRAAQFISELKAFETNGGFANLSIICLPNDHTSGSAAGSASPSAQAADNDLAFGQIVEAISKSKFWKETCIFAIEDDPQAGWDHVSGFRTTAYVISPYTKRKTVIHNNYNQTGMIRTMELILGMPPMNQMDASASPMSACFTETPDLTPYEAVPNQVPLDQINPPPKAINDPVLRHYAQLSATLPLEKADECPEDLLNHILWFAQKGSNALYPSWALTHIPESMDKDDD